MPSGGKGEASEKGAEATKVKKSASSMKKKDKR